MFADNDRISQRQLLRQMILALLGAWLLFLAGGVCQAGQNGLAGMALGFLLLAGWLLLLIRNAGVYENMEHYIGKAGRLLVIIVYLSFLVLTGSFLLRKISSLCGEYLISGISPEFLGLLLLLAAGAGIRNDIQQRARLAEIFYPFVMAGFVLMLILAALHMRAESFADAAAFSLTEVAREGWRTLGAGAVLAVLPFLLGQVEQETQERDMEQKEMENRVKMGAAEYEWMISAELETGKWKWLSDITIPYAVILLYAILEKTMKYVFHIFEEDTIDSTYSLFYEPLLH